MTTPENSSVTPATAVSEVDHPILPTVKPYPAPVDPATLFNEILAIIHRHVVIDSMQAIAVTLWIAMTWFMPCINVAPLLIITAPERACGKSQLLSLALRLACRPLSAANATASFLFRAIAAWQPTILIDEADTFIRENVEIKGMINAGHTRESAYVGRSIAKDGDFEPEMFCVWGAKVLAGIALEKHLPDATMSRGIVAAMRRKLHNETIVRLRHADKTTFEVLASQLARFAQDYSAQVSNARPLLPDELSDRAQDNWEPLLAIAGCGGQDWTEKAVAAALSLSKVSDEATSYSNELLADIQDVLAAHRDSKISTADLISALVAESEGPWAMYNHGRPITPRQLSKLLSAYGIKPKTVRMGPKETPKGYERGQFADAFSRYLQQPCKDVLEASPSTNFGVTYEPPQITHIPGTLPSRNPTHNAEGIPQAPNCASNVNAAAPATATAKLREEVAKGDVAEAPRKPVTKRPDSAF